MEIEVRTTHLSKNSWAKTLADDFEKKISHFEKISFKVYKDETKWMTDLSEKDRVFICDENGKSLSSHQFSNQISKLRDGGVHRLIFFIGGPFGLPDSLKERANLSICLSPFVMNQEVALTVLMEQVFRAYTIINNHPYHNE